MPHLVMDGTLRLEAVVTGLGEEVRRWGRAVLKTERCWLRGDGQAVLVEGVVVEFSRPLHPVAVVAVHRGDITVRLWSLAPVERTEAVQRWLCQLAADLQSLGAGPIKATNLAEKLWSDLGLQIQPDLHSPNS
jgi:hypothetical protein